MTQRQRNAAYVAYAIAICALALVLVTAVLAAAVSAGHAQEQLSDLRAASETAQTNANVERDRLMEANRTLSAQVRTVLKQNRLLVRLLRANGLDVPAGALSKIAPGSGSTGSPKASTPSGASPHSSTPASPGPTATPTPTRIPSGTPTSAIDPVCALLNLPTCPTLP